MSEKRESWRWIARGAAVLALLIGGLGRGQAREPSYGALKAQIKVFEAVINQTMAEVFAPPFGLLENAKGAYLPGFGVVFALEVNLEPARLANPFEVRPLTQEEVARTKKEKLQRIEMIKRSIPRLLTEHASSLREVTSNESLAVVVHLFHHQAEGETLPTQLVVQVRKRDLEQYGGKAISYEGFLEKVVILEF